MINEARKLQLDRAIWDAARGFVRGYACCRSTSADETEPVLKRALSGMRAAIKESERFYPPGS